MVGIFLCVLIRLSQRLHIFIPAIALAFWPHTLPFLLPNSSQIPRPGGVAFLGRSRKWGWTGDRREMAEKDVCCGPAGMVTGGQS